MSREGRHGQLLICERDPALKKAFEVMLKDHYELIFAEDPAKIVPLLDRHPVRLVVWDLDRANGVLKEMLTTLLSSGSLDPLLEAVRPDNPLQPLRALRQAHPTLGLLLIASGFEYDFQADVIQHVGLVPFLAKPWKSPQEVVERIQVILGDRKSSVREWVMRMPEAPQNNRKRATP